MYLYKKKVSSSEGTLMIFSLKYWLMNPKFLQSILMNSEFCIPFDCAFK